MVILVYVITLVLEVVVNVHWLVNKCVSVDSVSQVCTYFVQVSGITVTH